MHVRGTNNVGRAVQTDPTLLRDHGTQEMLGVVGSKSLTRFKFCVTTPNNKQQHATGRFANGRNNNVGRCWLTMLRRFARGL